MALSAACDTDCRAVILLDLRRKGDGRAMWVSFMAATVRHTVLLGGVSVLFLLFLVPNSGHA